MHVRTQSAACLYTYYGFWFFMVLTVIPLKHFELLYCRTHAFSDVPPWNIYTSLLPSSLQFSL